MSDTLQTSPLRAAIMSCPAALAAADAFFRECGISMSGVGKVLPASRKGPASWSVSDRALESLTYGFTGAIPTRAEGGGVVVHQVPDTIQARVDGLAGRGPVRYDPFATGGR